MTASSASASGALRSNPFSAARFAPGVVPWIGSGSASGSGSDGDEVERLFARAMTPGACHQILGAHGSGKSTLLCHLEARARRESVTVVRFRGSRSPRSLLLDRHVQLLLVDEVQELSRATFLALRLATRVRQTSLVVTTHKDFGLRVLAHCRMTARVAQTVIDHLVPDHCVGDLDERLARHRENLREVLFELYDEAEHSYAVRANVLSTGR